MVACLGGKAFDTGFGLPSVGCRSWTKDMLQNLQGSEFGG